MDKLLSEMKKKKKELDKAYYQLNLPLVSDEEYDALKGKIMARCELMGLPYVEEMSEYIDLDKPVPHPTRMTSLACVDESDEEKIRPLLSGHSKKAIVEAKLDGIAVNLIYVAGTLVNAASRGTHFKGEVLWHHRNSIGKIPNDIPLIAPLVEVRGEVVISEANLALLNEQRKKEGAKPYVTARNAAAGLLRLKDSSPYSQYMEFHAHGMGLGLELFNRYSNVRDWFIDNGFTPAFFIDVVDHSGMLPSVMKWARDNKDDIGFDCDGIVIKTNDLCLHEKLGIAGNDPKWAYAVKFNDEVGRSRVEGITLTVGQTGAITATLSYEPVTLGGNVCKSAVIPNLNDLKSRSFVKGAEITIRRSGDTTPYIAGVADNGRRAPFPKKCPSCGTPLATRGTETYYCPAHGTCHEQVFKRAVYIVSKKVLDIKGVAETTIRKVFDALATEGVHISPAYILGQMYSVWTNGEIGLSVAESKRVSVALENASKQPMTKIIQAACFPGIGPGACKTLSNRYDTLTELIDAIANRKVDVLSEEKRKTLYEFAPGLQWLVWAKGFFTLSDKK